MLRLEAYRLLLSEERNEFLRIQSEQRCDPFGLVLIGNHDVFHTRLRGLKSTGQSDVSKFYVLTLQAKLENGYKILRIFTVWNPKRIDRVYPDFAFSHIFMIPISGPYWPSSFQSTDSRCAERQREEWGWIVSAPRWIRVSRGLRVACRMQRDHGQCLYCPERSEVK